MAARPFDAPLGAAGADTKRWRSLALIALANVLLWTTVLGWMLLPRGSGSPSVSSPRALNAADSTVALAPGSGGAPATARPKAYSSIDTQTLAAARAREDVLAGKRAPLEEDEAQPVAAPSPAQPATLPPRADPTNDRAALPQSPPPRLTDAHDAPRRALSPGPRPVSTIDRQRIVPTAPAQEVAWPANRDLASRGDSGALQSERPNESRVSPPRAASPSASRDAAAAQLDDRWERREQWLRERLSR